MINTYRYYSEVLFQEQLAAATSETVLLAIVLAGDGGDIPGVCARLFGAIAGSEFAIHIMSEYQSDQVVEACHSLRDILNRSNALLAEAIDRFPSTKGLISAMINTLAFSSLRYLKLERSS